MKAYELKSWAYEDDWSEYYFSKEKAEERMKTLADKHGYIVQPHGGYLLSYPDNYEGFQPYMLIVGQKEITKHFFDRGLLSIQEMESFPDVLVHLLVGMMVREIDIKE